MKLAFPRSKDYGGQRVSYLFGRSLNEIANIIIEHENASDKESMKYV